MNILFVCSRNEWRSRTAETIFKNHATHQVRSAGTSASARIRITQKLIDWADEIYVMERKHKKRIVESFNWDKATTPIEILHIEDDYQYMDEELVDMLTGVMSVYWEEQ